MSRRVAHGLGFSLVFSLVPVAVALLGCSSDGNSSPPPSGRTDAAGIDGGEAGRGSGAGGGSAGRGGVGGISAAGGATGGGGGGHGGAEPGDAIAPDAVAPALDGGSSTDAATSDSSNGGSRFIANGPYAIAYTSLPGTDSNERASVTATFASTGELTAYLYAVGAEAPTIGTNTASEVYMDSIAALGRWSGGTAGGQYFSSTLTWTADQGLHYAVGVPTPLASLPTSGGMALDLLAATHPTAYTTNISPGTVTAGSVRVAFGVPAGSIGLTLSVTTSAGDYTIATTGGTNDPSTSEMTFGENDLWSGLWGGSAPATGTGPACAGSRCEGRFQGFLGGSAGQRIGCVFIITSAGTANTVRGALLFGNR